jgi:hypothetical protein
MSDAFISIYRKSKIFFFGAAFSGRSLVEGGGLSSHRANHKHRRCGDVISEWCTFKVGKLLLLCVTRRDENGKIDRGS